MTILTIMWSSSRQHPRLPSTRRSTLSSPNTFPGPWPISSNIQRSTRYWQSRGWNPCTGTTRSSSLTNSKSSSMCMRGTPSTIKSGITLRSSSTRPTASPATRDSSSRRISPWTGGRCSSLSAPALAGRIPSTTPGSSSRFPGIVPSKAIGRVPVPTSITSTTTCMPTPTSTRTSISMAGPWDRMGQGAPGGRSGCTSIRSLSP